MRMHGQIADRFFFFISVHGYSLGLLERPLQEKSQNRDWEGNFGEVVCKLKLPEASIILYPDIRVINSLTPSYVALNTPV